MPTATTELPRTTPESQGLSSKRILAFIDAIEERKIELHSLMILRHGSVVAEGWWAPYRRDDVHLLYSLSKSFTSTAIGLAIHEGRLTLDDPVISFFPDQTPKDPSENLNKMKVRHLLSMSAGQAKDDLAELRNNANNDWVEAFLARDVDFEPGSVFLYNSSATYMLSAILQKLTGMTTLDYLRPRLLDPLGIENATWETCPKGISVGGWGMSVTTDAIARFGQLYLQKGVWDGEQIVPSEWIETATSYHVSNAHNDVPEWQQGYGFQFWRCRHNCYRGDGAFGQYCVVMPEADMVFAATAATGDMQGVLNLVWEHLLLPIEGDSLPADEASTATLKARLDSLVLPGPDGSSTSPMAEKVSGRSYWRKVEKVSIDSIRLDFGGEQCDVTFLAECKEHHFASNHSGWTYGVWQSPMGPLNMACRGAWTAEDEYTVKGCNIDSPMQGLVHYRFSGDDLSMNSEVKFHFGPSEGPSFEGTAS